MESSNKQQDVFDKFAELPAELRKLILSNLQIEDLAKARLVGKEFKELIDNLLKTPKLVILIINSLPRAIAEKFIKTYENPLLTPDFFLTILDADLTTSALLLEFYRFEHENDVVTSSSPPDKIIVHLLTANIGEIDGTLLDKAIVDTSRKALIPKLVALKLLMDNPSKEQIIKIATKHETKKFLNLGEAELDCTALNNTEEKSLAGMNLMRVKLVGTGSQINLSKANLVLANLEAAELLQSNFDGALLMLANMQDAKLDESTFKGANLSKAILRSAYLGKANLEGAMLNGADLFGAELLEASLRGAHLQYADLRSADLIGADLSGADLSFANLKQILFDHTTKFKDTIFLAPSLFDNTQQGDLKKALQKLFNSLPERNLSYLIDSITEDISKNIQGINMSNPELAAELTQIVSATIDEKLNSQPKSLYKTPNAHVWEQMKGSVLALVPMSKEEFKK